MERATELAGFLIAHGIWCVSDGGPLIPMLGQESPAGERKMQRFAAEQLEDGVAHGRRLLESNPERSDRAALVYDGYITLPTGRTDSLFVIIRYYAQAAATLTMAIPYQNAESAGGFAVHRPKFLEWQGQGSPDYQALTQAFFRGVDSHSEGARVWMEHSNDSA
ncbi:hypothetical protein [Xanthomonas arboricola]|uniref:hypothetical protein n=1 Tax=Xanthomonas arboricola TaxID=56448 RepID=UPI0011B02FFF|nr:hypothetical protein [Xanthomonas arboricola]